MNINDIYSSSLSAAHLNGHDLTVTITGGEIREFDEPGGVKKRRVVLHLDGHPSLILNKTNAVQIANTLGTPELTQWKGRSITLYQDMTTFGGRSVPCVRVRPDVPKITPPQQQAAPQGNQGNAVRF
jgi:hypothetical protein